MKSTALTALGVLHMVYTQPMLQLLLLHAQMYTATRWNLVCVVHCKEGPPTSEWATILAIQLLHDACAGLLRLSSQDSSLIALLALVGDRGQGLTSDGVLGGLATLLGGVCLLTLLQGIGTASAKQYFVSHWFGHENRWRDRVEEHMALHWFRQQCSWGQVQRALALSQRWSRRHTAYVAQYAALYLETANHEAPGAHSRQLWAASSNCTTGHGLVGDHHLVFGLY
jgi:hypothetical protein